MKARPRFIVCEDGSEYMDRFTRFLGDDFAFVAAADFASALPWVFVVAAPLSLVALFFALRLPERPLREEAHFTLGEALP